MSKDDQDAVMKIVLDSKNESLEEEKLTESKSFDLLDDKEVEEAEKDIEELKNETTNDEIMQIVDASAESTDELRDSYIGGMVLQCPVCKATMFKDMDQLVKEEDGDLYNVEEECPHCGSKGGFDLIGQLAKPDVNPFGEPEEPKAEETAEAVKAEASKEKKSGKRIIPVILAIALVALISFIVYTYIYLYQNPIFPFVGDYTRFWTQPANFSN